MGFLTRPSTPAGLALGAALMLPLAAVSAQSNPQDVPRGEAVFVQQAPADEAPAQVRSQQIEDASSKVYFPDEITPETVAIARARAAEQEQLERSAAEAGDVSQLSTGGEGARDVAQLSDGGSSEALAQLSAAERQVLLEAVDGTDICERGTDIPALQELCERRIETRSAEFSRPQGNSAEDSLLGGGLDSERVATLEAAINRLARNDRDAGNFSNQVIASVALGNQTLGQAEATDAEGDPTAELSQETQALVAAIVQQLGGN